MRHCPSGSESPAHDQRIRELENQAAQLRGSPIHLRLVANWLTILFHALVKTLGFHTRPSSRSLLHQRSRSRENKSENAVVANLPIA